MKKIMMLVTAAVAGMAIAAETPAAEKKTAPKQDAEQVEARAMRMVKNAVSVFEQNEDDRAVGMLEAVGRMYPDTKARFRANLELGRHFLGKRNFDRAGQELRNAQRSPETEVQAESLLLQGQMFNARSQPSEAMMVLRRLTQDYPTSAYANDAFFMIGQIHFDAHRWTRASEAFQMVGTAVPESNSNEVVQVEAGQRVFVHVKDKDLAILQQLGQKTTVLLESKSGDKETVELHSFGKGDGDFLASVATTAEPSEPGDGKLMIHGAEDIRVTYIDRNTESGEVAKPLKAEGHIVSSGSIAFMDGALRQRVRGVFVGQPAFIRVRDLDLDATAKPDAAKVTVKVLYRERPEPPPGADPNEPPPPPAPDAPWLTRSEIELSLPENADRSGIFLGKVTPVLMSSDTNAPALKLAPGEVGVQPEDKLVCEYVDATYLDGDKPISRVAEALVLVGGSTEPQSIMAHASEASVQAKKLLIEAQLLHKWGSIFKEVGLEANAAAKADEGLEKVNELMDLIARFSLERDLIESTYEVKWNLHLVKKQLEQAIATCKALVERYPDTLLADRAFMQIANANKEMNTPESRETAVKVYGSIVALKESPLKAEAQFRIGEVMEINAKSRAASTGGKADFSSAMAAFKRCADAYPNSSFAGEAIKRVIDYYISERDYARSQETLERVFQDYPDAPWLDEMLLKWGVVCHRLGDRAGAIEKFRRLVEEYPGGTAAKQATGFLQKIENQ